MYAIVRAGGRQEKVSVGDEITVDRRTGAPGDVLILPAVMLVDGAKLTTDSAALAKVNVGAEIVSHSRGPKIKITHYKNKTGYRRRMGFRAELTTVRITGIKTGE